MVGTATFGKNHTAKDSAIMSLFTFGEGYHNFHHTFQSDYRNGVYWYQFDPSKWIIWTLAKLGMAKNLKTVDEEVILLAHFKTKEVELKDRFQLMSDEMRENYEKLKVAFENGLKHYKEKKKTLSNDYLALKHNQKLLRKAYKDWERFTNQIPSFAS